MFEKKQTKSLASHTTLRWTEPAGKSRRFTNFKSDTGRRAFCPPTIGAVDGDWHKIGGPETAKVEKL